MLKKGWFCYAVLTEGCAMLLWGATFFTHRLGGFLVPLTVAVLLGLGVVVASGRKGEYESLRAFWSRCCRPLFVLSVVMMLYVFLIFFVSAFRMEFGGPEETPNGFYLMSHGAVLRTLTEVEFVRLKKAELRMGFAFLMAFAGGILTYLSARVPELWRKKKISAGSAGERILDLSRSDSAAGLEKQASRAGEKL